MQHAEKSAITKLLITRKELKEMGILVSNSTLLRWEASGEFPKRVRMSRTSIAWLLAEVEEWLNDRAGERARYEPSTDWWQ
jgi:predicted DNA-binding transcriptional regulator AlpA